MRLLEDHVLPPGADPFSRSALLELGRLIPADHVEYFELRQHDRAGLEYVTSADQPDAPGFADEAFTLYGSLNPLGAFRWRPSDGAVRLSSVISFRRLRDLPLYDAYWGHYQIRDQLKIWLRRTPESAVCINLDRCDGAFSDRDVALLDVIQPELALAHAHRRARGSRPTPTEPLTRREAQVLSVAASGRTNAEIGAALDMSPGTVRKHLERAYAKLGSQNRGEAVALLRGLARSADPPAE